MWGSTWIEADLESNYCLHVSWVILKWQPLDILQQYSWVLGCWNVEIPGFLDCCQSPGRLLRFFCFSAILRPAGLDSVWWWAEHSERYTAFGRNSMSIILIDIWEMVSRKLCLKNPKPTKWVIKMDMDSFLYSNFIHKAVNIIRPWK